MPTLRTWAGLEDSPGAVLRTEARARGYDVPGRDEFATAVEDALLIFVGQDVDLDGLRNVIHGYQNDHGLEMTQQDEYELAQELFDAFAVANDG